MNGEQVIKRACELLRHEGELCTDANIIWKINQLSHADVSVQYTPDLTVQRDNNKEIKLFDCYLNNSGKCDGDLLFIVNFGSFVLYEVSNLLEDL